MHFAASQGDTVRVHYTGMLPDGTVLESSRGGDPLEFTLGRGEVIPGIEHAVEGMSPGESKMVWVTPDEVLAAKARALVSTSAALPAASRTVTRTR